MKVLYKAPKKSPRTKNFSRRDYFNHELTMYGLCDEYEIESGHHLVMLYNGDIPMNERQNFTVHADSSLFCGTIFVVEKREDGSYEGLSDTAREVAYDWIRNKCSWI
jgi:hypothetical protein